MSNSNPATQSLFRSAVVCAVCWAAASGVAHAQSSDRPSQQLFGRTPNHGDQQLDVTVSAMSAYDDDVLTSLQGATLDPRTQVSGGYDGLTEHTKYSARSRHLLFAVSESTALR